MYQTLVQNAFNLFHNAQPSFAAMCCMVMGMMMCCYMHAQQKLAFAGARS